MSSSLQWEPINELRDSFSCSVKFALRQIYGEPVNETLSTSDIPMVKGLIAGGCKDAKELLDAIEKHGSIHVREVY